MVVRPTRNLFRTLSQTESRVRMYPRALFSHLTPIT